MLAQEKISACSKSPRWVSDKGFWQIETNIYTPDNSVVYFYNNQKILVYKEHVQGVVLNLNRVRTKMKLKKALENALTAWNKNQPIQNDQQLLSALKK